MITILSYVIYRDERLYILQVTKNKFMAIPRNHRNDQKIKLTIETQNFYSLVSKICILGKPAELSLSIIDFPA